MRWFSLLLLILITNLAESSTIDFEALTLTGKDCNDFHHSNSKIGRRLRLRHLRFDPISKKDLFKCLGAVQRDIVVKIKFEDCHNIRTINSRSLLPAFLAYFPALRTLDISACDPGQTEIDEILKYNGQIRHLLLGKFFPTRATNQLKKIELKDDFSISSSEWRNIPNRFPNLTHLKLGASANFIYDLESGKISPLPQIRHINFNIWGINHWVHEFDRRPTDSKAKLSPIFPNATFHFFESRPRSADIDPMAP